MDWQEQQALKAQANEWGASTDDQDRQKALETYKQLAKATEGQHGHSEYLEKIQDVEMDLLLDDQINESTQKVLTMIEEMETQEGIVWDEVDMVRVLKTLSTRNDPYGMNLYGDVATLTLMMADQMMVQKPEWYPRFLKHVGPSFFTSCWGGPMWSLRLMWHGGVLVRNFHRVQGFNYEGFIRLPDLDGVIADLEKVREAIPVLIEEEDSRYYYLWMLNAVGDEVVSDLDFSRLNRCGNCLIGISSVDALAACDVLTPELLGETIESSRGGVALRIFEGGMMVYNTGRWGDSLDYCTDNMYVGSYGQVDPDGAVNEHAGFSDICGRPPYYRDAPEGQREGHKMAKYEEEDFYRNKVQGHWDDQVAYALENLTEDQTGRLTTVGQVPGSEKSAIELLFDRTVSYMTGSPWADDGTFAACAFACRPIFAGSPDWTSGYGRASFDAEQNAAWQANPTNPVTIRMGLGWSCSSLNDILAFQDPQTLLDAAAAHGFVTDSASVEIFLPPLGEEEDPWHLKGERRPLTSASLRESLVRICAWLTYDDNDPDSLQKTLERYATATISDEGNWVPASGDAADLVVPEDRWETAPELDEVGGSFLTLRCDLPMGKSLDMLEMGKALGAALDEGLSNSAGETLNLNSYITVDLDPFGLSQSFCDGEVDSGNMEP